VVGSETQLGIRQQSGGEGLGAGDAEHISCLPELRVVGDSQHRHFVHVQPVGGVEKVAGQIAERQACWVERDRCRRLRQIHPTG